MLHTSTSKNELPPVASPFEGKHLGVLDHLKLSAYWFGSNFVWGALLGPVLAKQMEALSPQDSAKYLGYLYSLGALPALLIPLFLGPLSDRCTHPMGRRRPFILVGGIVGVIGLVGLLMASKIGSVGLFFMMYFVLQTGSNTALAAYSGVIPDLVPEDQRGTASGYMAFMSQISTLFGAVLGGKLVADSDIGGVVQAADPTGVYVMLMAVYGLFLYLSFLGIKENRLVGEIPKFDAVSYLKSLWIDPRKYPDFAWVWITRAMMMFGFYAIQPFILYFLRDMTHVAHPETDAGKVFGVILLFATVSAVLGGWISDRTGRKPVVYVASGIIAAMSLAFIFCTNLTQVLVAGVLFGLGYGAYISVDWALGTDVLPRKEDAGKDMAVWHVSMTLPQQIAPLLAGALLNLHKLPGVTKPVHYERSGYTIVFIAAAICFTLGGVWLKNVRGAK